MLRSMTGYGRGEASHAGIIYSVEMRSVNHRFCDVSVQSSKRLKSVGHEVKRMVQDNFERGRFDISISLGYPDDHTLKKLVIDLDLARTYLKLIKSLKDELGLPGQIDVDLIMRFDILKMEEEEEQEPEETWQGISDALSSAMSSLKVMREAEGKILWEDLSRRLDSIGNFVLEIEDRQPEILEGYGRRLQERAKKLLDKGEIEPFRLEQEVAIFAEKSDISEEIVRLNGHLQEFHKLMNGDQAVGRKLEFLLQEMNREVNTAATKAVDIISSQNAINVKSELEKMRQQIQNVE